MFVFVVFMAFLIILVAQSIFRNFGWDFLSSYRAYVLIPTTIFGILTLWLNKDKIDLNCEAGEGKSEGIEREGKFEQKLSKIGRIPLLQRAIRWKYEEGWTYSIGVILLIVVGLGLRIWNLGVPSFGDDELTTAYVARNFADSGNFVLPSGTLYNESWLDILFRVPSVKFFGFDEFGARLPSVILGSLTIGLAYLLGKELGGKKVGLVSAFIICFLPWEISWSREARMYAAFQLFYLSLIYVAYLALVKYKKMRWYILSLILFIAAFAIHPLCLVFVIVPYSWVLLNFLQKRRLKPFLAMLFGALVLCFPLFLFLSYQKSLVHLEPFAGTRFAGLLFNQYTLLTITAIMGMFCLLLNRNKLGMWLTINFFAPFIILICFLEFGARYIYHLIPLLVITGSFLLVYLGRLTTSALRTEKYSKVLPLFIMVTFVFALIPFRYTLQIPQTSAIDSPVNPALYSMAHPDWKGLKEELPHLAEEDRVIIGTNELGNLYYFGRNDYTVRREETMLPVYYYEDERGNLREIYSGSIWIKNYAEFVSIIKVSSAYLIVDHRFSSYYIPEDIMNYVEENGVLVGSKGELKVYFLKQAP